MIKNNFFFNCCHLHLFITEEFNDEQAVLGDGTVDMSSATATATEDSGLEGNLNEQGKQKSFY